MVLQVCGRNQEPRAGGTWTHSACHVDMLHQVTPAHWHFNAAPIPRNMAGEEPGNPSWPKAHFSDFSRKEVPNRS